MRPKERIANFLEKVDWEYLLNKRWNLGISMDNEIWDYLYNDTWDIKYWLDNPDQRVGQVLINLNIIPDDFKIWVDEDVEILKDQGVPIREVLLWGQNYDKDMNRLAKTNWLLLKDMATDHIENILIGGWSREPYTTYFKEELEYRKNNKIK